MKIYVLKLDREPLGYFSSYSFAEEALCNWFANQSKKLFDIALTTPPYGSSEARDLFRKVYIDKSFNSLECVNKTQIILNGFSREPEFRYNIKKKIYSIEEIELNENIPFSP